MCKLNQYSCMSTPMVYTQPYSFMSTSMVYTQQCSCMSTTMLFTQQCSCMYTPMVYTLHSAVQLYVCTDGLHSKVQLYVYTDGLHSDSAVQPFHSTLAAKPKKMEACFQYQNQHRSFFKKDFFLNFHAPPPPPPTFDKAAQYTKNNSAPLPTLIKSNEESYKIISCGMSMEEFQNG